MSTLWNIYLFLVAYSAIAWAAIPALLSAPIFSKSTYWKRLGDAHVFTNIIIVILLSSAILANEFYKTIRSFWSDTVP